MKSPFVADSRSEMAADYSMRRHSKTFSAAARWLPSAVRSDVELLYAFCRRTDDSVDESTDPTDDVITRQRHVLDLVYSGHAVSDPLWTDFGLLSARRRIPKDYPAELFNGMAMDTTPMCYPDMAALHTYTFRVAGVVGLMMCHVTGLRDDRALTQAAWLGMAMQLTNICRDVAEDWERGRLYVPTTVLRAAGAFGLESELGGPLPRAAQQPLQTAVRMVLSHADSLYALAMPGISALDAKTGIAVRIAAFLYRAIGHNVRNDTGFPFSPRAFTTRDQKVRLAVSAAVPELINRVLPSRWSVWDQSPLSTPGRVPEKTVTLQDILITLRPMFSGL